MNSLSRLVWFDGMFLGSHHFQAQGRYFEGLIHFVNSALRFEPYGFISYDLSPDALRNGTVLVTHARGIFPDGLPFDMPDCDPPPEGRNIADLFPPTADHLGVSLAIEPQKPDQANCALSDGDLHAAIRYIATARSLPDENTGRDAREVKVGRKNTMLLFEGEAAQEAVSLPLARILRDGSGGYVLDREFIPPCLRISASERLMVLLRRLIGALEDKSRSSVVRAEKPGEFRTGLSLGEVASLWFLHSVNSSLASLRNFCFSKQGHPEELFQELSRLAGALCTFGMGSDPATLPLYDHRRLGECFAVLDQHIRNHLNIIVPPPYESIPLEPVAPYFYSGKITDLRCLRPSRWILEIQASCGERDLITKVPTLIKVCSRDLVADLVGMAPGLPLTHLPVPPADIGPRVESQYFSVSKDGRCWDQIVETREVGVYVPADFPNARLELLVVLES